MSARASVRTWPAPGGALAVHTLHAGTPGPRLAVVANVHGDEPAGTFACLRLARELEGHALRGALILVPSANPGGLARRTRRMPADEADLNRAFPGDPAGGPTARHAAAVWALLDELRPDAVLDLHADTPDSIPYALVDRVLRADPAHSGEAPLAARAARLAHATGVTVVHEFPDPDYTRMRLDRSLAGAVLNRRGIPSVTLEVGCRHDARGAPVDVACAGVRGVLAAMDMLGAETAAGTSPAPRWTRGLGPRSTRDGLLLPAVAAGKAVAAGSTIARIVALDGREREALLAPNDGMVLAWADTPWISAGSFTCAWATAEGT